MSQPKTTGLRRIINATGYSWQGLQTAWKNEAAFRQEVMLTLVLLPLAWWLGGNGVEKALLMGSCLVVLITELLNSAVESVVDRIGSEQHPLSGAAKDIGSAAVFIALLLVVVVWGLVIFDRFS